MKTNLFKRRLIIFFYYYYSRDQNELINTELINTKTGSKDSLIFDKSDILDLPLPEIPVKKKKNLVETTKEFNESIDNKSNDGTIEKPITKMHYRNSNEKPKYLFGESTQNPTHRTSHEDEIFLNKSGWVQVNQRSLDNPTKRSYNYAKDGFQSASYSKSIENYKNSSDNLLRNRTPGTSKQSLIPKNNSSKIEDLISRNEARKSSVVQMLTKTENSLSFDSQIKTPSNERPGFLPVKNFTDRDSPPPITPIISPPPAFQDTKRKNPKLDGNKIHLSVTDYENRNKGMVFSRSFEYDNRKNNSVQNESFSKSFDYDLKANINSPAVRHIRREKSPTFSTLTGNSPSYLSKRESFVNIPPLKNRDNSPIKPKSLQKQGSKFLEPNPVYPPRSIYADPAELKRITKHKSMEEESRSRREQFSRIHRESSASSSGSNKGFKSLDSSANLRLNSCDSGARSGNYSLKTLINFFINSLSMI